MPDRHPAIRPVTPSLCRIAVRRPASTVRDHAATPAAESTIYSTDVLIRLAASSAATL